MHLLRKTLLHVLCGTTFIILVQTVPTPIKSSFAVAQLTTEQTSKTIQELTPEAQMLLIASIFTYDPQRPVASVQFWERRYSIAQEEGEEAYFLGTLALIIHGEGYLDLAVEYYQRVLEVSEDVGTPTAQAELWVALGSAQRDAGQLEAALGSYQKGLELQLTASDFENSVMTLRAIAFVQEQMGQEEAAIAAYQQAITTAQLQYLQEQEAITLDQLASFQHARGNSELALDYYQQALKIVEENSRRNTDSLHIRILNNVGDLHQSQQQTDLAEAAYEQAQLILQKDRDLYDQAFLLRFLGEQHLEEGRRLQANIYFQQAADILAKTNDEETLGDFFSDTSFEFQRRGQLHIVLEYALRNLALEDSTTTSSEVIAMKHQRVGQLYYRLGLWQEAIATYEVALDYYRSINQGNGDVAYTLESLGHCYTAQNQPELALNAFEEALSLYREASPIPLAKLMCWGRSPASMKLKAIRLKPKVINDKQSKPVLKLNSFFKTKKRGRSPPLFSQFNQLILPLEATAHAFHPRQPVPDRHRPHLQRQHHRL